MTIHPTTPRDPLTPGYIQAIGELAAAGLETDAIAQQLNLDNGTVERGRHIGSWLKRERFSIAIVPDRVQVRCRRCFAEWRLPDTALFEAETTLYPLAQDHTCKEERRGTDGDRRSKFIHGDSPTLRQQFAEWEGLDAEQAKDLGHHPDYSFITKRYAEWVKRHALRRRYEHEQALPPGKLERGQYTFPMDELHRSYREWLRVHGITSETGRMTKNGRAFMEESMDAFAEGAYNAERFWTEHR